MGIRFFNASNSGSRLGCGVSSRIARPIRSTSHRAASRASWCLNDTSSAARASVTAWCAAAERASRFVTSSGNFRTWFSNRWIMSPFGLGVAAGLAFDERVDHGEDLHNWVRQGESGVVEVLDEVGAGGVLTKALTAGDADKG